MCVNAFHNYFSNEDQHIPIGLVDTSSKSFNLWAPFLCPSMYVSAVLFCLSCRTQVLKHECAYKSVGNLIKDSDAHWGGA